MKLEEIRDPKLRARITRELEAADALKADLGRSTSGPPSGYPQAKKTPPRPGKRIRQASKPLLNKLEQEAMDMLHARFPYSKFQPHAMKLELANGSWYCPDIIEFPKEPPLHIYEVKGKHSWDDAIVKLKVAARTWQEFHWWLMWKEGEVWKSQRVLP